MENTIDWEEFIDKMLDGHFAFDIRKMGSASMFVKNQLNSLLNPNMEKGRFKRSLGRALEGQTFNADDSLTDPEICYLLMDLGLEFMGSDVLFIKKCCTLFSQLSDLRQGLPGEELEDLGKLHSKSSFSIIKFIANWKDQNEILGITDIYEQHIFIKYVMQKWLARMTTPEKITNPNIFLGLIYLNEWTDLSEKDKRDFFSNNAGNTRLFSAVISDMERLEGNSVYNYFDFAGDCSKFDPDLLLIIADRCPSWIKTTVTPSVPVITSQEANIKKYQEWVVYNMTKDLDLGSDSLMDCIDLELKRGNN